MDPKANIREQLEVSRDIIATWDAVPDTETLTPEQQDFIAVHALRLAELVLALDEWRRKGGFDPYAA